MESKDIQNSILKAVDTIATRRVSQLELDKTITAIIKNNVGIVNRRKIYRVQYDGGFFNATAQNEGDAYLPGMAVYVSIPQGNFSNEKFIIGRASSLATNEQISTVAALANNYGIVGANNIKANSSKSFGVHSYHSLEEEKNKEGEALNNIISHRYNLLYKYDANETEKEKEQKDIKINNFDAKLYTKDANAIMFRADFMNILSSEQKAKASGEFGVVFNLAFKNKAYEIGETQGEIFDHYAKIIQNENIADDGSVTLNSLAKIDSLIKQIISGKKGTVKEVVATDTGLLDQSSNNILALTKAFALNNAVLYDDLADAIVNAYLRLIEELRVCKSFYRKNNEDGMSELYESWRETKIKEPKEKIVSYYLSSNSMIGNPFHFSSWISQYEVFEIDLESFLRLDSIILYKEGFIQDANKEANWPLPTSIDEGTGIYKAGPDIFVRNLQMYFMKPLTDYNGTYQLKVEPNKRGSIFYGNEDNDYKLTLKATVFRELYEDLTRNQNTKFYWFKSDANIVSPNQAEYSPYGGLGWAEIPNNNSYKLSFGKAVCPAYENYFRCVAVYTGEETPIILRYDVIVYNKAGRQFVLSSDIGEHFGFDAGNPVLTLLTRTGKEEEFKEVNNSSYKFKWYLINNNAQKVYLLKNTTELSFQNVADFSQIMGQAKLLNNIEFFKGEDKLTNPDNYDLATRIKYPMSNLGDASTVTFEVYIEDTSDEGASFTLGKASLKLSNLESGTLGDYRLEIIGGDQVFQYDEYGNAPNSKKFKDPLQIQPLRAKLFNPSNIEIASTNFKTKWYFPIGKSMIKYDKNSAKNDPTTGENRIFEGSEVAFEISDGYNPNTTNNNIYCVVTLGEKTFSKYTTLLFTKVGENGTNGTDMVAKIVPTSNSTDLNDQPVIILNYKDGNKWKSCFNYEHNPNMINILQENKIIATTEKNVDYPLRVRLYQKSQEVVLTSDVKWNIAGNTSTASNKIGKYLELYQKGIKWNRNSSTNPYLQSIIKAEINYGEGTYYAFYTLPSIDYYIKIPNLTKNRIGIKNDTYLKEIIYNSDGRNPKYNHEQGLELLNVPSECYIEWEACGGYNNENKQPRENEPTFKLLSEAGGSKKEAKREIKPTTDKNGNIHYPPNMVYVLPDDSISGNITNNYIKATVKNKAGNKTTVAVVYAPISFSLNTFGLASINAWDGNSINLDNENGAVFAPQVGAGKKDANNKFTGVLMGDATDYSERLQDDYEDILRTDYKNAPAEHLTGLFGFSEGTRSFFLDAETGQAIFGKPNLKDENGKEINKIKFWNAATGRYEEKDNYNEGQIKLIPGGESVIGGWRIGRQVLYYATNGQDEPQDIGEGSSYKDTWADKAQHRRDIGRQHKGILLNAAPLPYISIKGKPLTVGAGSSFDIDSSSGNAEMLNGDSLELNLDPNQKDFFTLFVHHFNSKDKKWTRTPLVGIDPAGRFYSNSLRDKETALTMNHVAGFGAYSYNKKYVGLLVDYTENGQQKPIFKAFRSTNYAERQLDDGTDAVADPDTNTTFISGGILNNEYARSFSFHGKKISLYSSSDVKNTNKTTNSNFILQDGELSAQLTQTNIKFSKGSNDNNVITTAGHMHINVGTQDSTRKNFFLTANSQNIQAKYGYTLINTNSGGINITSQGNNNADINIKRENNNPPNNDNTSLSLQKTQAKIKVGDNKSYLLLNDNSNGEASRFYSRNTMELTSEQRIFITGTGNAAEDTDGFYGIILKANIIPGSQRDDYVRMRMGVYDNTKTGAADSSYSMPFELDMSNSGSIRVYHGTNPFGSNIPATTCMFGMNTRVSGGLFIESGYTGVAAAADGLPNYPASYGLIVKSSIFAGGGVYANDFHGDGSGVTNTASGSDSGSANITISGVGGSGTAYVPTITLSNGRPNFSQESLTVNLPTAEEIWDAISENVSSAISSALSSYAKISDLDNYAKTSDLDNYLKKNINYTINNPNGGYVRNVAYDSEGKVTMVDKAVTFSVVD